MIFAQFDIDGVSTAIVQLGLAVCLVVFFVWRDYVREQHTHRQLNELESFIRVQLMEMVQETNRNITLSTRAIEESERIIKTLINEQNKRN